MSVRLTGRIVAGDYNASGTRNEQRVTRLRNDEIMARKARATPRGIGVMAGFFAPTARGQAALQRIKGLKHELEFRFPDMRPLAIASFNDHEVFFGEAFGISLADGTPAWSGCVAFGIERWLLAILCTHGVDPKDWPMPAVSGSSLKSARSL